MTVAEFMELALYHPEHGYYTSAIRRSGSEGDFFTNVDVGPAFGEMLAVQLEEMWRILEAQGKSVFHLVEAGAGDGRFTRDILDAAAAERLDFLERVRVTLVDRSAAARAGHTSTLAAYGNDSVRAHTAAIAVESCADLPLRVSGVILANELLDAMPVHVLEATTSGLKEVYVAEREGELIQSLGPLSDAALAEYIDSLHIACEAGTRLEVGMQAVDWMRRAAATLECGFLVLIDYGHEARELYSATHRSGTLTTYRRHTAGMRHWLEAPGESDLTAHVNLTAVRHAAESAGLLTLAVVDQTYFLAALGILERLSSESDAIAVSRRLAAKTLLMPGGLGSTMKVMVFAKNVGQPALRGLSWGRLT